MPNEVVSGSVVIPPIVEVSSKILEAQSMKDTCPSSPQSSFKAISGLRIKTRLQLRR